MENVDQVISFVGMKPNFAVRRMLKKQLDRWIKNKTGPLNINHLCNYHVRFEHEAKTVGYSCYTRIQIGNCTWEGHDVGRSIQEALSRALKHVTITFLNPKSSIQFVNQYNAF